MCKLARDVVAEGDDAHGGREEKVGEPCFGERDAEASTRRSGIGVALDLVEDEEERVGNTP